MSLREKNLYKRRVNKEHNSNFRAGYVSVNEEQLHKTGIRGRKRYIIYLITCLVIAAVVVNLLITFTLFGILRLSKDGMEGMEFTHGGKLLRFLVDSDMGDMYPMDSTIGSMTDGDLEITAEEGQVLLRILDDDPGSVVLIDEQGITINSTEGLTIIDPDTGDVIFSTDFENHARFPNDVRHIQLKEVVTSRITSNVNEELEMRTENELLLRGGEGIKITGAQITANSKTNVDLSSKEGDISLDGATGVHLNRVQSMPAVDDTKPQDPDHEGYKVCVCKNGGKLFPVQAQFACHEVANDCPA